MVDTHIDVRDPGNFSRTETNSDIPVPYINILVEGHESPPTGTAGNSFDTLSGGSVARSQQKRSATVQSKISSAFALPLPTNITDQTEQGWSNRDQNIGDVLFDNATQVGRVFGVDLRDNPNVGDVGEVAARVGSRLLDPFNAQIQRNFGVAINPLKEVYYEGVNFRTYNFQWDFGPRNAEESREIMALIRRLEFHAHPAITSTASTAFEIPETFIITFEHTGLPPMKKMVLQNIGVDYTASGVGPKFNTDGDENLPAFINLTTTFVEVEIRTKRDFR